MDPFSRKNLIKNLLKNIKNLAISFLSASSCELCQQTIEQAPALCQTCRQKLKELPEAHCLICAAPFESSESSPHTCSACLQNPPVFKKVYTAFEWCEVITNAMHKIKFAGQVSLIKVLSQLAQPSFQEALKHSQAECIVPVPLSWRRRFKRGYNQSTLLAKSLCQSSIIRIPFIENIHRSYHKPQAQKNRSERLHALQDAFHIPHTQDFSHQRVLIIDDIMTSGATAQALSQKILAHGAKEIHVFVLARVRVKK